MRNDRIIPGLILVFLGVCFLLHNYGYLHFHWVNFLYLWPIFIVMAGINLLFAHNKSPWATVLKAGVLIAGFSLLLFGNFGNRYRFWPAGVYINNNDNDDDDSDST